MGHLMCAACFTHLLADGRYETEKRKLNDLKNYLLWFDQNIIIRTILKKQQVNNIFLFIFISLYCCAACAIRLPLAPIAVWKSRRAQPHVIWPWKRLPPSCPASVRWVGGVAKLSADLLISFIIFSVLQQGISVQISGASWTTRMPGAAYKVQIPSHWLPMAWTLSWEWAEAK